MHMFRAMLPRAVNPVSTLHKKQGKQSKEQAGNFKPEDAARVGKWTQQRLAEGFCTLFRVLYTILPVGASTLGRNGYRRRGGSLLHPLSEHVRGDANPDAERPAHFLWLHGKSLPVGGFALLLRLIRSKVGKTAPDGGDWGYFI
jgi:hypothetical protein